MLTIQSPNRQRQEPWHKEAFSKTRSKLGALVKPFFMRLGLNQSKWLPLIIELPEIHGDGNYLKMIDTSLIKTVSGRALQI